MHHEILQSGLAIGETRDIDQRSHAAVETHVYESAIIESVQPQRDIPAREYTRSRQPLPPLPPQFQAEPKKAGGFSMFGITIGGTARAAHRAIGYAACARGGAKRRNAIDAAAHANAKSAERGIQRTRRRPTRYPGVPAPAGELTSTEVITRGVPGQGRPISLREHLLQFRVRCSVGVEPQKPWCCLVYETQRITDFWRISAVINRNNKSFRSIRSH
jgi:hypothetical protein